MALSNTEKRHSRQMKGIFATCEQMSGPQRPLKSVCETVQGLPPWPPVCDVCADILSQRECFCITPFHYLSLCFSVQLTFPFLVFSSSFLMQ